MGNKRSFSETEQSSHPDFQGRAFRDGRGKQRPKRQKVEDENLASMKKRVRTIERRLRHSNGDLPANVHSELQRELAAHQGRIAKEQRKRQRGKMIKKYHMVRFFERKKATRLAKQLRAQIDAEEDPEKIEQLKADLHVAEVDMDYAKYFPFMERYISLYPASTDAQDEEKSSAAQAVRAVRPPMWKTIEKVRNRGQAALETLQNRLPEPDAGAEPSKAQPARQSRSNGEAQSRTTEHKSQKERSIAIPTFSKNGVKGGEVRRANRAERRRLARELEAANAEDSDGGFFEEG